MAICSIIIPTLAVVNVLLELLWLGMSRVLISVIIYYGEKRFPEKSRSQYR